MLITSKWAIGKKFSMSGINSRHHYLPTYKILMISDNVEFLPPIFYAMFWQPFWKFWKHRIAPLMVTYHLQSLGDLLFLLHFLLLLLFILILILLFILLSFFGTWTCPRWDSTFLPRGPSHCYIFIHYLYCAWDSTFLPIGPSHCYIFINYLYCAWDSTFLPRGPSHCYIFINYLYCAWDSTFLPRGPSHR
jgi:hypothetical protein